MNYSNINFQMFSQREKKSYFYIYKQNTDTSHWHLLSNEKGLPFFKQHFSLRIFCQIEKREVWWLPPSCSVFLQDRCSKFIINYINIDSLPEWGHPATSHPEQGISLGGGKQQHWHPTCSSHTCPHTYSAQKVLSLKAINCQATEK